MDASAYFGPFDLDLLPSLFRVRRGDLRRSIDRAWILENSLNGPEIFGEVMNHDSTGEPD